MTTVTREHLDLLVVGAGISGIGMGCHFERELPGRSYAILESRPALGGTWDLFRYPGIRSDSDLHTLGYAFKPWTGDLAIADGQSILDYITEAAEENGVAEHIRYGLRAVKAAWSSEEALWTVEVEEVATGERSEIQARWLFGATGYYRYDRGHRPEFPGEERFAGPVIHPQFWPEDLDYAGKRVVVIGSGATAITLVPTLARDAAHVTMLQRSPTYVMPVPAEDRLANAMRDRLGPMAAYRITRALHIVGQQVIYRLCRRFPRLMRRWIRSVNAKYLPEGYPVDVHFRPAYDPWDQRLCAVPDADLYRVIGDGSASVVTDRVASFTETGIELESGESLQADIIVTATGFELLFMGGIEVEVDGQPVSLGDAWVFKGMMLSGVPNFALAVGYTSSSWTLKVDLVCEYFCRLMAFSESLGCEAVVAEPVGPIDERPLLDFGAGYVKRYAEGLPRQGARAPWRLTQAYPVDARYLRHGRVDDPELRFFSATGQAAVAGEPAAAVSGPASS